MGKKDFGRSHYCPAKEELSRQGQAVTAKISSFSDTYDPAKDFAGLVIYSVRGEFKWHNDHKGYRGRFPYFFLLDTSRWPAEAFRAAGNGRVHDYLYRQILGGEYTENIASVAGFSVQKGVVHYSSVWLNKKSNSAFRHQWESDGSKLLSEQERALVDHVMEQWKVRGTNIVVQIPSDLDRVLTSAASAASLSWVVLGLIFLASLVRAACRR